MPNLNCGVHRSRKWEREAGFHQQLDNDLMYFRRLVAMDLQGNLIFVGSMLEIYIVLWSRIGVKGGGKLMDFNSN